ncbi:hypothetical protein [Anaerobacillus arseniciselenatis]|uniref:hypothetical protein n=1 Tax=Anaerobacillus arseniciselenatis TaxID=85682 RepID=UPI001471FEAB|nr:hypothetical protein [Anaerobacillus arseniciselenatis]
MTNHASLEIVEEVIQRRFNEILEHNEKENFDKLPGLVESLKIIKEVNSARKNK